jgi:hypothetical protein
MKNNLIVVTYIDYLGKEIKVCGQKKNGEEDRYGRIIKV